MVYWIYFLDFFARKIVDRKYLRKKISFRNIKKKKLCKNRPINCDPESNLKEFYFSSNDLLNKETKLKQREKTLSYAISQIKID